MFGFGKKKPAPPLCKGNPGIGVDAKVAFANGQRTWSEEVNLVSVAVAEFKKQGYSVTNQKTWLEHPDSGFMILPQLVGLEPLNDGGVRTVTTMQVNHATLAPGGVFEYQHSAGNNTAESISKGFDQWLRTDFVPLLEALRPTPGSCMTLVMDFPAKESKPARTRRAVLGPVAHFMQQPPPQSKESAEEHPFCACCLLTKSFEAFREFIEGDGFFCLRLFAARDTDGKPQADCRVNGEDWEQGAQALRNYAQTWPAAGYEFRKQYVVLQSIEGRK